MQVEIKKIDKLKCKLNISLAGAEFSQKKNQFYKEASQKLKVPGFRPGKAPLELIKKHHGKNLQQEFVNKNLPLFYQQALEEKQISPASLPKISEIKITPESLSFSAELETQPQIEVDEKKYKGIPLKDQKIKADSKQVEEAIKKFKEEVEKDNQAKLETEQLAKWASYPDIESFKNAVSLQIEFENLRKRRQDLENQIRTHLLSAIKLEVPKTEVERYRNQLVSRQIQQLKQQGVEEKEIEKYKTDFEKKISPLAENEVKFFYILNAIAKKEKIKNNQNPINATLGLILSQASFK